MKSMTSSERLLAAMRREEVDRIPLSPRMEMNVVPRYCGSGSIRACKRFKREYFDCDPARAWGFPVVNPFYDYHAPVVGLKNVDTVIRYEEQGDIFMVTRNFKTPAGSLEEKVMVPKSGVKHYGSSPNPHRVEHLIKTPDDLERIRYLFPSLEGLSFVDYHQAVEEMGDDGLVLMNVPGPMDYMGGEAYSMEKMMMDYYDQPEFFDKLLGLFTEHSIGMVRAALENDVRHFFLVYFYPSLSSGWSPKIIRDKFMPVFKKQVEMIHAAGGLADYYDDGRLMGSIDFFVEAGVDVVETCSPPPVGDFNLAEARKRWGRRVTFKGLVDMINVVARGTPAQIDDHIREIVGQNEGKTGLILGTMDNIRPETPDENIAAYFNSANKYR
ncbi:MAG: uroporphyrinogen decarboxylase family protein [Verrucomicrobiae bacterium]|nr:uroporphyrinogen decarboxylase family protein [Verrucomicrobiae bacterium]